MRGSFLFFAGFARFSSRKMLEFPQNNRFFTALNFFSTSMRELCRVFVFSAGRHGVFAGNSRFFSASLSWGFSSFPKLPIRTSAAIHFTQDARETCSWAPVREQEVCKVLVPRLCLGTQCWRGSASKRLMGKLDNLHSTFSLLFGGRASRTARSQTEPGNE